MSSKITRPFSVLSISDGEVTTILPKNKHEQIETPQDNNEILFVRDIQGKTQVLTVNLTHDNVLSVKRQLGTINGQPSAGHQNLMFKGQILKDEIYLYEYCIEKYSTFHLTCKWYDQLVT
jgi:hypothetical protein